MSIVGQWQEPGVTKVQWHLCDLDMYLRAITGRDIPGLANTIRDTKWSPSSLLTVRAKSTPEGRRYSVVDGTHRFLAVAELISRTEQGFSREYPLPALVLRETTPDHVCAAIAAILNRQTSCHAPMTFLDHVVGLARYTMHLARTDGCLWTDFSIQKLHQRMLNEIGGTSLKPEMIAKTWGLVLHMVSIWDEKCLLGKEATYLSAYGPLTGLSEMMLFQELDAEGLARLAQMWCKQAGIHNA